MQAFHNDQAIKNKYVARVMAHQAADNLIRGTGWKGGKGCAIGCTLENYDHSRYPVELGIPEWLARVEDLLFEGMSLKKSHTWPEAFLRAIKVGDDLERIKAPFLIMVLRSTLDTFDHDKHPDIKKCIEGSIALWQRDDIGSRSWKKAAEASAREAAEAAALAAEVSAQAAEVSARAARAAALAAGEEWAAEASARAAAWAAGEEWAAEASARAAARVAAQAAEASARAARAAEASAGAARAAKHDYFADRLIKMLEAGAS